MVYINDFAASRRTAMRLTLAKFNAILSKG